MKKFEWGRYNDFYRKISYAKKYWDSLIRNKMRKKYLDSFDEISWAIQRGVIQRLFGIQAGLGCKMVMVFKKIK
jgi:hypothetical protein